MTPGCVERCPGCRYRELSAEESDRRKHAWVAACMAKTGAKPAALRAPARRWGYRRKALLHARRAEDGWRFGLLRRSRANPREAEHVPIPDCPLHAPELNARLKDLRILIPAAAPVAFVLVSGAVLTLVLKRAPNETDREWARALEPALRASGVESLQINWNPAAGRRALSARHQEVVFGPLLGFDGAFHHGAHSFRQQIPELEAAALDLAEDFLREGGVSVALDLYCGVGASLHRWTTHGWQTAGVELVGDACQAAALNSPSARLFKGKVEDRLPQLDDFLANRDFVLFTNPPRDGHAEIVLEWIASRRPKRIAYLSCNARTLARDLDSLASVYAIEAAQPFDFFPQTDHVETLALLARR